MAKLANKSDRKYKRWMLIAQSHLDYTTTFYHTNPTNCWRVVRCQELLGICLLLSRCLQCWGWGGEEGCTMDESPRVVPTWGIWAQICTGQQCCGSEFTESGSGYIVLNRNRLLQNSDPFGTRIWIQSKIFYDKEKMQTKKKTFDQNRHWRSSYSKRAISELFSEHVDLWNYKERQPDCKQWNLLTIILVSIYFMYPTEKIQEWETMSRINLLGLRNPERKVRWAEGAPDIACPKPRHPSSLAHSQKFSSATPSTLRKFCSPLWTLKWIFGKCSVPTTIQTPTRTVRICSNVSHFYQHCTLRNMCPNTILKVLHHQKLLQTPRTRMHCQKRSGLEQRHECEK
jgi:hypothetical protein